MTVEGVEIGALFEQYCDDFFVSEACGPVQGSELDVIFAVD